MKSVVVCPSCSDRRMKMTLEVGSDIIMVACSQCGKELGKFSTYALKNPEENPEEPPADNPADVPADVSSEQGGSGNDAP